MPDRSLEPAFLGKPRPTTQLRRQTCMPRYVVPPNAGPYAVVQARAGNPLVCNNYTGQRKVLIPCRTREQADNLCKQLNGGKSGEIFT